MSLIDYIDKALPAWASLRSLDHWHKLGWVLAAEVDALIDLAGDGARASMPGQVEEPGYDGYAEFPSIDALDVIGRERRLAKGLVQSPADYASDLRRHLNYAHRAGTALCILQRVASILSPNPPVLRLVTSTFGGTWYTRSPNGDFVVQNNLGRGFRVDGATGEVSPDTNHSEEWDWDSLSNPAPPDAGENGRFWLIVYAPCNDPYLAGTEGTWGDGATKYGDGKGGTAVKTIGTTATSRWVELVRGEAREWRAAGMRLSHIIVAFDESTFNPLSPVGLPDGHWGNFGKIVGGVRVRARLASARYIRGVAGLSY